MSLTLVISINLAIAQQGQEKEKMKKIENAEAFAQKQTERLTEKLSLSADQTTKVAAINLEYDQKMKAAKEAAIESGEGREAIKALRNEKEAAIKAVLTPEQVTTFEQKRRGGKHRKKGRGRKGGGRKDHSPEERAAKHTKRLTEKLSLSADQTAKVAAINLEYAQKMKAAKEAATESGEGREAIKALRNEKEAAIKAVLTPEQAATFEQKRGKHGRKGRGGKDYTPEERAAKQTERLTENYPYQPIKPLR